MKTAIVGTRTADNYEALKNIMDDLIPKPTEIISGGASGADKMAERYAKENKLKMSIIKPDWQTHGKSAGPIRNLEIVAMCERMVAIWDGESRGTKHSIEAARKDGKLVVVHQYAETQQMSLW
jgi:YspA, cpYpsA-related SLOG family